LPDKFNLTEEFNKSELNISWRYLFRPDEMRDNEEEYDISDYYGCCIN